MEMYQAVIDYLWGIPVIRDWPEVRALLAQAAARQQKHWRLPLMVCEAVGQPAERAIAAVAAIACAQIGVLLIDDMLDEDPRGEYHHSGPGKASNYAAAFQAASLEAVLRHNQQPAGKLSALQKINRMLLVLALGQHLDVQAAVDETIYWKIVENKSASFFGTAFYLGAMAGGASKTTAGKLERIGRLYGEMIQVHDDLNDTMAVPANPDWLQGRSPLPILFAKVVDHTERTRFVKLCEEITDETALRQAQDILVRCGAVSYCVDQLLRRYQSAREVLRTVQLARPDSIESLLEEVIAPVQNLFEAIGVSPLVAVIPEAEADQA
jgi:geranylgeranyl pyrophosphate synthase